MPSDSLQKAPKNKDIVKLLIKKFEQRSHKEVVVKNKTQGLDQNEQAVLRGIVPSMISKYENEIHEKQIANAFENKESDLEEEVEESISLTREEIIKNPFPQLSAKQQKEVEEEFKGALRETADFQPQIEARFETQSSFEKIQESDAFNPFHVTPSVEVENLMRPSGDFGLKAASQDQSSQKVSKLNFDLNEIEECQGEHKDSARGTFNEGFNIKEGEKLPRDA